METRELPYVELGDGRAPRLPPKPPDDAGEGAGMLRRAFLFVAALALALVMRLAVAPVVSTTEFYAGQIQTLDEKKDNVLALVASTASTSALVSAIPGDTATPIAEKLADLSSDLLIVLSVIYLEKYLLTTLTYIAAGCLLPLALILWGGVGLMDGLRAMPRAQAVAGRLAWICAVFGIMLWAVVPASVWVTERIDQAYEDSLALTVQSAEAATDAGDGSETADAESADAGDGSGEETGVIDAVVSFLEDAAETISEEAQGLSDAATQAIAQLVDSIAVMIVTSCLIPVLVLVAFFWLAKTVAGIDLGAPAQLFERGHGAARRATGSIHKAAEGRRARNAGDE